MGEWITVAPLSAIAEGETLAVDVAGELVCLYNLDGTIYATQDVCTHGEASLADGYVDGDCIECPLHSARFDIRTGKALCAPATEDLRVFPVEVHGMQIRVFAAGQTDGP